MDVVKDLVKSCPKLKLLIVGDGPDMEEYQEYVQKEKMKDHIILTGKAKWEEMPYYYHLANIFLTASQSETQGLTVIEAMASEVTPICIDDESFANTVIDGLNGRIFKTQEECKEIIQELYKDSKQVQKLSKQARINAERYSSKYFAESVLDVYQYAIDHKTNRLGVIGKLVDKIKGDKDEMDSK